MKRRIVGLIKIYCLFVLVFVLQKPLFMLYYASFYSDVTWTDWLQVMWHGLPLDLSLAGYLTIIPGLLTIVSVWTLSKWLYRTWGSYYLLISITIAIIGVVDVALYRYWGFRLDATPLFYFFSSPKNALASISMWQVLLGVIGIGVYAFVLYQIFMWVQKQILLRLRLPYRRVTVSGILLLLTALLFIPIRGGFTVSTMNTGKVYYSANMRLNHAAINPAFNLMESLSKQKNFAKQYRFMDEAQADTWMQKLLDPQVITGKQSTPLTDTLFTTARPNILFVVLESFSSKLMTTLGGEPDVAVQLDSLATQGVLFTRFYANSFRTDRGLVSILSGYPAQPSTSIMKYPRKTQQLPSIARVLKNAGYRNSYYYGGDADFTNMRSYLVSSGFDHILSDTDFPVKERLSKWGVHDEKVFDRLLDDLQREAASSFAVDTLPFFRVLQTSSSHEPFEVPYHRLANERLNAFAYTDSCVGDFIRRFRQLPQWKESIVVLTPDHLGAYPEGISNLVPERYQIPLIITGGAVRTPKKITVYGSQHDIAATLLAQLELPHNEFVFSKDMLNPQAPHFAFFTVPDAFGMVTEDNSLIYDCAANRIVLDEGKRKEANLLAGQAYLQKLYDDMAQR
ncbi:MAG: sulfatase-like hydrolase/transferase [Mediterranea sp.]|jgi:phosphoglycerol transferase MdoB-like AlkP superfamily enzyme|nr:sulfatase-like hydrolase/transferase [Mediterranea sp.]